MQRRVVVIPVALTPLTVSITIEPTTEPQATLLWTGEWSEVKDLIFLYRTGNESAVLADERLHKGTPFEFHIDVDEPTLLSFGFNHVVKL